MGHSVKFNWKVELYQGGQLVEDHSGWSGSIPDGGTYGGLLTWDHTPMCGDFHVKAWIGAYEGENLESELSEEWDIHCDCSSGCEVTDGCFTFTFVSAMDNGDGTTTINIRVQNSCDKGLSHAAFSLPSGVQHAVSPANGSTYTAG